MNRPWKSAVWLLTTALMMSLAWLSACSKKSATGSSEGGAPTAGTPAQFYTPRGAVYDVKYTANTVRIDLPTVQKTLKSVSSDGQLFLFEGTDPQIRGLAAGKVLFLEHIGVLRVTGVANKGSEVVVATAPAGLTDFIQDGKIQFSMPVDFRQMRSQLAPKPKWPSFSPRLGGWLGPLEPVYASGGTPGLIGLSTSGEANGWNYTVSGAAGGSGLTLSLDAGKNLAGMTVKISAQGDLSNVNTGFTAVIQGGKMTDFEYQTPVQGKLHVTWAVLTNGPNSGIGEARLQLPPLAKDVIDVYGLPLLFKVDEALIFKPGFGGNKDAAQGGFDVTFDGNGGLNIQGAQKSSEGKMEAQPSLEKTTAESLAAHGVVLAINAPKISVSLGTESIKEAIQSVVPSALLDKGADLLKGALNSLGLSGAVTAAPDDFFNVQGSAYVQLVTEFDYAGSGPLSLVPCSMTHLNFYGQAGAGAQLLTLQAQSPSVNFDETKLTFREPDIDACGQK
ncbi:MAG TPA: hypothetical protein VJO16_07915 [Candidatus Acidoferrum sp.]|nr:hypothetical protein [Candidatus Acidoferrum sp.]